MDVPSGMSRTEEAKICSISWSVDEINSQRLAESEVVGKRENHISGFITLS